MSFVTPLGDGTFEIREFIDEKCNEIIEKKSSIERLAELLEHCMVEEEADDDEDEFSDEEAIDDDDDEDYEAFNDDLIEEEEDYDDDRVLNCAVDEDEDEKENPVSTSSKVTFLPGRKPACDFSSAFKGDVIENVTAEKQEEDDEDFRSLEIYEDFEYAVNMQEISQLYQRKRLQRMAKMNLLYGGDDYDDDDDDDDDGEARY